MRTLVTGASGYLGRSLVPALRDAGHDVFASLSSGEAPAGYRELVRGDLTEPRTLSQLAAVMASVQTVFHLAGLAHQRATARDYRRINLDATVALAEAARGAGVRRFVFVSSVKAAAGEFASATRGNAEVVDYGSSKYAAEVALEAVCANSAMELLIVRPALVYGGHETGHLALLRRWVHWRLPRPPAGGELSMIGRDDLVALLCTLGSSNVEARDESDEQAVPDPDADSNSDPDPDSHKAPVVDDSLARARLIVATDGERYTTRRLHDAYCRALGKGPLLPAPPSLMWRLACALRDGVRGEPGGTTWARLTGDLATAAKGMDTVPFAPRLTFEGSLGL